MPPASSPDLEPNMATATARSQTLYSYQVIRSAERDVQETMRQVTAEDYALVAPARPWASFLGLFGLGSNEMVVVLTGGPEALLTARRRLAALPGVEITSFCLFSPTVRPTESSALTQPGLYVLRFFDVGNGDVEEVARLSSEAWVSFTDADDYRAEPQALFRQVDHRGDRGKMLLVTWYEGFDSWQTSRAPAPEARDNFLRRRQLTAGTTAYATRLVIADEAAG
ncbi:MAG: hypothetical protein ACRBK7_31155 [Acidimicrobiales bacterium]